VNLAPNDLHVVLDRAARTCRVFDHAGTLLLGCEARNRTVNDGAPVNERWAPCPPGIFRLGAPVAKNTAPFGPYFIPMEDWDAHHAMRDNGRSGIGLHGGGSGLPDPLTPNQGWVWTHGCWRFPNGSLKALVRLYDAARGQGGHGYATVVMQPGALEPRVWGTFENETPEADLDPEE
jgi:hypothetical protein